MGKKMETYSLAEVAKHNKDGDAWLVVDGVVYDVSRFAGMHPGGEFLILQAAGTDCSEDFWGLHRAEVLTKYQRLAIGYVEGYDKKEDDGVSPWGKFSKVPYSETFAWRGWKSPYGVTEQHREWRKYIREFYDKEVLAIAIESEKTDEPATLELMQKISQAGLLHTRLGPGEHLKLAPMPCGIKPEEYTYMHEKILQEETSRLQCPGFVDSLFAGFNISVPPIFNYGSDWMKKEILPELLAGRKRSALAITEAFAGSDVSGIRTKATKSPCGKYYIVNGTKKWISSGTFADYFVTAVRTGGPGHGGISMMLIPRVEGVNTKIIKTSYSSSAGTSFVTFDNVKVPVDHIMGKENQGFKLIMANFNHERLVIAMAVIAGCRVIVEECFKWATQRKAFGKPLISQPVIRNQLGRMVAAVESVDAYSDLVVYQMDNMSYKEQNMKLGGAISLLKYQATETARLVADEAVHIFGGRGVTKSGMGRVVETFARTYLLPSVYGGDAQVMLDLGVKQELKKYPTDARL